MTDQTETVTAKPFKAAPAKSKSRAWSVTTLAQRLVMYVHDNDIGKDETVGQLFESFKRAIVAKEVGQSLDL